MNKTNKKLGGKTQSKVSKNVKVMKRHSNTLTASEVTESEGMVDKCLDSLKVESLRSKAALTEKESAEFDKDLDGMVENLNNNVILGKLIC